MANFVIAGILLIIIGMAIMHIVKAKKNGQKCIGCPSGCNCSSKKEHHSECHCQDSSNKKN